MNYISGVDGGGSKTTVQIADVKGKVVAQAVSGARSYNLPLFIRRKNGYYE